MRRSEISNVPKGGSHQSPQATRKAQLWHSIKFDFIIVGCVCVGSAAQRAIQSGGMKIFFTASARERARGGVINTKETSLRGCLLAAHGPNESS